MTIVATLSALKTLGTCATKAAHLCERGREGFFLWDGSDLSPDLVIATYTVDSVNVGTGTASLPTITSAAIDPATDTITATGPHGLTTGAHLVPTTSTPDVTQNADYRAIVVDATRYKLARNGVAAALGLAVNLTVFTPITVVRPHLMKTGDAIALDAATGNLGTSEPHYIIRTGHNSFRVATSYANAMSGAYVTLTDATPFTFHHLVDPASIWNVTPSAGPLTGLAGAWQRGGETHVTVKQAGADWRGNAPSEAAFQAALNYAFHRRIPMLIEAGEYILNRPLWLTTYVTAHHANRLGVRIEGAGRQNVELVHGPNFPNGQYMWNFDANPCGLSDQFMGVMQGPHTIGGFRVRGNPSENYLAGTGKGALRFRGVSHLKLDDFWIYAITGSGIFIDGTSVAGKDDVDTSMVLEFANGLVEQTGLFGLLGTNNRVGAIKLDTMHMLSNYWGNRVNAAAFTALNSVFSGGGHEATASTGNLKLNVSATGADARGASILGCMFENGAFHELAIDKALGAFVGGTCFHPYQRSAATSGQVVVDVGLNDAQGIVLSGNRIQSYSNTYGYTIPALRARANAKGVHMWGLATPGDATHPIVKDAGALNVTRDGSAL